MIRGKSFFIDQTRCTACRGCQVACKQWKNQKVVTTVQQGSYQNPPDLDASTFKLVRFSEVRVDGMLKWLFFPEQCRHCVDPPCKMAADMVDREAIVIDKDTGAVLFTERTRALDPWEIRNACPYDIPRVSPDTGALTKCNMCIDRVTNGLKPACVKTCPTQTMHFGDREEMLALAAKRLAEVKKTRPQAQLVDAQHVRVIFLAEVHPRMYYSHLMADREIQPKLLARRDLFRGLTLTS
jgi:formate dehydrogenase iron-sulfur subunit